MFADLSLSSPVRMAGCVQLFLTLLVLQCAESSGRHLLPNHVPFDSVGSAEGVFLSAEDPLSDQHGLNSAPLRALLVSLSSVTKMLEMVAVPRKKSVCEKLSGWLRLRVPGPGRLTG